MNYTELIEALDAYHKTTSTQLDTFIEIAAPEYPKNTISKAYTGAQQIFNRGARKVIGSNLNLATSRTDFIKKLYFHGEGGEGQRYHYIDFRFTQLFKDYGFDMDYIMIGGVLHQKGDMAALDAYLKDYHKMIHDLYPTQKDITATFKDFLFGKPFDPTYRQREHLSHGMTRIAKQFYKLDTREDRAIVRSFADARLRAIFKENPYRLPGHSWSAVFNSLILLVDIYAICRFLRFFRKQGAASTSVFLTGVFHAENYRAFMSAWGATEEYLSNRDWIRDPIKAKKCVHVDF
jgi:hypothetical protein